jgi:hypothetical protein
LISKEISDTDISFLEGEYMNTQTEQNEKVTKTDIIDFIKENGNGLILRLVETYEADEKRKFYMFIGKTVLCLIIAILIYLLGKAAIITPDNIVVLLAFIIGALLGGYKTS